MAPRRTALRRKGDSLTNVILFVTMIVAALIVVVWYAQTVRPTRYVIGTVTDDLRQVGQHLSNACGVTIYNATYAMATTVPGTLVLNATDYCLFTDVIGNCVAAPCALDDAKLHTGTEPLLIRIQRGPGGNVSVSAVA